MKKVHVIAIVIVAALLIVFYFVQRHNSVPTFQASQNLQNSKDDMPTKIVAENLDTPWALAFLPDQSILVTERRGTVRFINNEGILNPNPIATIQNVKEVGEGGLLGIVLHPNFSENNYVYLYYTYSGSDNSNTLNRVIRITYRNNQLVDEQIIIDRIPGAANHNGGRIKFGPDNYLYVATGDAQEPSLAQDTNSLAGKILRVTDTGAPAPGNPFNNQVYSYGHRNPQGLAWDGNNVLWATEHGPSGGTMGTGNDEVNKITSGKDYGWPEIQGDQTRTGMETPIAHSGTTNIWAPAGASIVNNFLFFSGLRGEALYRLNTAEQTADIIAYFGKQYGRIREVILGPDQMLYLTTSNRDGRGNPKNADDKIIRVSPNIPESSQCESPSC